MIYTVTSMQRKGQFKKHYHKLISQNVDWDKFYDEERDALVINLESLVDIYNLFKGLEMQMGHGGHITVDFNNNSICILDSWIE